MNYRHICALAFALLLALPALAQQYTAGTNYRELREQLPTAGDDPEKIEVIEFFWYGCPHCYALEPYVEDWLHKGIPDNVNFVRVPAALNKSWENHARAYYVAQQLDVLDQIHEPLFDAIHQQGQRLSNEDQLRAFFESKGVSAEDFDRAWNSYPVETNLRRAALLARTAGISGVPSMIVAGRYEISARMAGGNQQMLDVVDYLVDQESAN